ncbi:MAG: carboxypeptidase regulatory-like domain-containing protein [Ruminococcaceae bacterium]|nr:carboxypeptidase regulatory-like domain-containing protein [Oscillospiraceae bacterium]
MDTLNSTAGYGYMIVRVTTARGAIPLANATVYVQNFFPDGTLGKGDVIAVYTTNASGLTEKFALPAPPRNLSLSPGNGKSYATYNLTVAADGYGTRAYVNVPVFEGITAIQNVDMIPLSENGQADRFDPRSSVTLEIENPYLESSEANPDE